MNMPFSIDPVAAEGFSNEAIRYEKGRPGYPQEALEILQEQFNLAPEARILDLGAGTGKWTRQIIQHYSNTVALEPVADMAAQLKNVCSRVEILQSTAEAIPLPDASVDLVTCAQAFHWFDFSKALLEIDRVLVSHGGMLLLWNTRDYSRSWLGELSKGSPFPGDGQHSARPEEEWKKVPEWELFESLSVQHVNWELNQTKDEIVDGILSLSRYAILPALEKEEMRNQMLDRLNSHPATRNRKLLPFPYRTDIVWTKKRK